MTAATSGVAQAHPKAHAGRPATRMIEIAGILTCSAEPVHLYEIADECGISMGRAGALLAYWSRKGVIRRVSVGRYELTAYGYRWLAEHDVEVADV